ncbi:MAG TPA: alpha/beta fold hydrolase, partial [Bacteroidales bacterium]|nr:alpha/beta fold hydrolase [Bacteroidales bacterium]
MNEQHFVHRGRRLYYRDIGEGPCILLLHGFPFDGRIWFPFAERLSTSFRLIIPDLAGFGSSDVPAEQLSMELMAGDVAALVSYLNIDRHVVVGHSMGGYVALAMA